MLPLLPYEERLESLVFPNGLSVLLFDEWDLAIQRALIAALQEQLEDAEDTEEGKRLRRQLRQEERRLVRMEEPPAAPEAERSSQVFTLRPFTHGERLAADDRHTTVDTERLQHDLNVNARNLDLLKLVLVKPEGLDPQDLPDAVCQTLIRRMWHRNSMNPDLLLFFRGSRHEAGETGAGP